MQKQPGNAEHLMTARRWRVAIWLWVVLPFLTALVAVAAR